MNLLFDQNLSHRLVTLLAEEFPGSVHVRDVGMVAAADTIVWQYAAKNCFLIASKDADFQQRALSLGCPPKVIWVRLFNCSAAEVAKLLRSRMSDITEFDADPTASFLALSFSE